MRCESSIDHEPLPWRRGLLWLALLGAFFFASYGLANWVTSLRPQVDAIVFAWEPNIPFLPWTIVPYWIIDLLYAASLLSCRTRRALDTHAWRLLAAQLIAVSCFLVFPLRFSFDRPETDGVFGWMFAALAAFDQPFNQAPSLHIALLVILWLHYAALVQRAWRWLLHIAFMLIGVSVLTTWQHHFIDLPTGLWLGWFCVWLFPDKRRWLLTIAKLAPDPMRRRLALRYVGAAVAAAGLALAIGGAGLWLLWVAGSLVLVAVIYLFLDETAFQKRPDGSVSPATRWLFAPYFLGAWINSRWWTRNIASMDTVAPNLLLGRIPSARALAGHRIAAVIDVSAELPFTAEHESYCNIPMLDLVVPSAEQIERACLAITQARLHGRVLVCCALGYSRSATAVAAWCLCTRQSKTPEEAIALVRAARPTVVLASAHIDALRAWQRLYNASHER